MLIVFAPQVLLYGLAVVLYGILQSHRRFGAPALAPLLSSLVVVGAYAGFGVIGGAYVNRLHELPPSAEYLLSGGTTLGVLALVLTAVVPAWRLRIGIRPTLRFPAGVGARVRKLAIAGVLTLVAQDASVAVVIVLANRYGDPGALVLYGFAWAVFVVPYAVLAVPIATSTFPELSAASDVSLDAGAGSGAVLGGGSDRFDATAAASTRAVMLASWLGAAALVGARRAAGARLRVALRLVGVGPRGGAGRFRAGARRVRAVGQPVPGAVRAGPQPGAGRGDRAPAGCW